MSLLEDDKKDESNLYLYATGILIVAVLFVVVWLISSTKNYDNATLCEVGAKSPLKVILFDQTGGFTENQQRVLKRAIEREIEDLKVGDRLALYEVDESKMKGLSDPLFDKCKPRDGADADGIIENGDMMAMAFEKNFSSIVMNMADNMTETGDAPSSPIIESLIDLRSLSHLQKGVDLKRIVLVSDMLQHSPLFSFYIDSNVSNSSPYDSTTIPDLSGVDVQLYYLLRQGREGEIQKHKLVQWWEKLFVDANANDFRVMKVR